MIRPISPQDTPGILSVCESTGLFPPDEMTVLQKLFDDFHGKNEHGHRALLDDEGDTPVGIAYFTPKEMTDRTWELLMIMVHADRQGRGIGSRLLRAVEDELRAAGGRMLLIETASVPELEQTRQFYRQRGYAEVAHVPDYYADGVGKVSFTKLL